MHIPTRDAAPTPSPGVVHASGLERVRRLQFAQTVVLLLMAAVVVVAAVLSARAVVQATARQRAGNESVRDLAQLRDQGRLVQVHYWRQRALTGTGLSGAVAGEVLSVGGRIIAWSEAQRGVTVAGPRAAAAAAEAGAGIAAIQADLRDYLAARNPAVRLRIEERALARVDRVATALDTWVAARVEANNADTKATDHNIRALLQRMFAVMGVTVAAGLLLWWALGRTRGRVLSHVAAAGREQDALRHLAELVARDDPVDELMSALAGEVVSLLGADAACVLRLDEGRMQVVGCAIPDPGLREGLDLAMAQPVVPGGAVHWASTEQRPERIVGYERLSGPLAHWLASHGMRVGLSAPISVSGATWGALAVVSGDPDGLPEGSEDRLLPFARLAGLALSNAEARRELALRASTDPLTGLPNHGAFHERLAEEVARALRHGQPLSLAVLDLDHFKEINDTHGHQVGDQVLHEVALRLAREVRDGDMLARVGGEEFAWILPSTDLEGAFQLGERARAVMSEAPVAGLGGLSVSVGVGELSDAGTPGELFRLADAALLIAKAEGRNMTVRYSPRVLEVVTDDERLRRAERARTLAALRALARAVDARDPATQRHSERVADVTFRIAIELGWPDERAREVREAALVHDIGKIGVPDSVLRKPTGLSAREQRIIEGHAALGATIVSEVLSAEQVAWVRHHHERIDGDGYPAGLRGTDIPLGARLLAVADSWDAMTTDRPYRAALSVAQAAAECRRVAGTQLDADAVDALLRLQESGRMPRVVVGVGATV